MAFYLGRPGALAAIPSPRVGLSATRERQSTTQVTLNGGRAVDRSANGRRTWALQWAGISSDRLSVLEEFYSGARGAGPHVLLDPARRNHLTVNQSSACSEQADTTGFTVVPGSGETLTAQTGTWLRGPYALKWSLPATSTPTSGLLTLDAPAGLSGFPVPTSEPWTFAAQVRGGGADPALSVTAVLSWLAADGSLLSTTTGTAATTVSDGWQQVSVTRSAPPSGAVFVSPRLQVDTTTVASGASGRGDYPLRQATFGSLGLTRQTHPGTATSPLATVLADYFFGSSIDVYVDQPQLDMSTTVRAWVLGTGVPRVTWTDLPDDYPLADHHTVSATLLEVG